MKVSLGNATFRVNKMFAWEGKEYLDNPTVQKLMTCVDVKTAGGWVRLEDEDAINKHVESWESLVVLEEVAAKYNFGFLDTWKFRKAPSSDVPSVDPKNLDPFFYSLIAGDYTDLYKLKTAYSLEDAFSLLDALITERTNEHYAMKAAKGD